MNDVDLGGRERRSNDWLWLAPVLYALVVGLYSVVRYGGRWAESDSAIFTRIIRAVVEEGMLVPARGLTYSYGYAYQAISSYIAVISGLELAALQQLLYPVLVLLVAIVAWVAYRELVDSIRGAALATFLLFAQPEFLFVILRSSHEKFTRLFMLLCLFLLVRSLRLHNRPVALACHIGLFYLAAFALIASNSLLAHSFIFAVAIALGLGWLLERWRRDPQQSTDQIIRRLTYATITSIGLVYLFIFYAYPIAQQSLRLMGSVGEQTAALVLDVEVEPTDTYAQVISAWISPAVYFLLSLANWLILIGSLTIWLHRGWRWLRRGETLGTASEWLLWLLYAAFALQGAISVVVDASGAIVGNLQHRVFPSFSIIAVGMVASALVQWRPRGHDRAVRLALSTVILCLAILSVLKATNEPALSNMWIFYRQREMATLEWADRNLESALVLTDFNERLRVAFETVNVRSDNNNHFTNYMMGGARTVIITTITRLRSSRLERPLPVPPDALRVYDNGEGQVYRLRPQTPFQR